MTIDQSTVRFDPFDKATITDPYPVYRRMRNEAPVHHNADHDIWTLTRFEDVAAAAMDWRSYSSAGGVMLLDGNVELMGPGDFLQADPPRHDEMRAIVRRWFTPRAIATLEDEVTRTTYALLDELLQKGSGDVAAEFAWPLPTHMVSRMLGVPPEDDAMLHDWFTAAFPPEMLPETADTQPAAAGKLHQYFKEQLAARKAAPSEDLLSVIAQGRIDGNPMGDDGIGMCFLLYSAGAETTASSISNALVTLHENPDKRAWLAKDPTRIRDAVDELARMEAPVQFLCRHTAQDTDLHGITIPEGAKVLLMFGSGNRDERRFADPDVLDFSRGRQRTLSFGEGIHRCIGAELARIQGRVALRAVLAKAPEYEITGVLERFPQLLIRSWRSVQVDFRAP